MAAQSELETNEGLGNAYGVTSIIFAFPMIPILVLHSFKVYQDLLTAERKSVSPRRIKPKINKSYKQIAFFTWLSIFTFTVSTWTGALSFFATTNLECDIAITIQAIALQIGKLFMYIVFLLRLYSVYEKSAYRYPFKCIVFFLGVVICYSAIFVVVMLLIVSSIVHPYSSNAFANWCGPGTGNLFLIFAVMVIIQDLAVAVGFLWAFMNPLRKTIKFVLDSANNDPKVTRKIAYTGTKTTILTASATFTTLIILILFVLTGFGNIVQLDQIINSLCMMFMTAYYPDATNYQRWCCCCICCCDRKGRSKKIQEEEDIVANLEDEPTEVTVQTNTKTNATSATRDEGP